jgi:hypothetical protein
MSRTQPAPWARLAEMRGEPFCSSAADANIRTARQRTCRTTRGSALAGRAARNIRKPKPALRREPARHSASRRLPRDVATTRASLAETERQRESSRTLSQRALKSARMGREAISAATSLHRDNGPHFRQLFEQLSCGPRVGGQLLELSMIDRSRTERIADFGGVIPAAARRCARLQSVLEVVLTS